MVGGGGQMPFRHASHQGMYEAVTRGNPPTPPDMSLECVSVLSRMLAVGPRRRAAALHG